jgi:hypothetical protein
LKSIRQEHTMTRRTWAPRRAFLFLGILSTLSAQTVSTEILGLVTDSTGAVIPGATVKARRIATGDVRTTTSNETGNYVFPLLDIGEYEVTCSAAGFKTEVRRGIELQLQQKARIDFQMQLGQQVETVGQGRGGDSQYGGRHARRRDRSAARG